MHNWKTISDWTLEKYMPGMCDDVSQSSTLKELHDNPEFVAH